MTAPGERAGSTLAAPRRARWRTTRRGWYAFTSARAANALLGAIMIAGLAGILIPQFGTSTLADPVLYALALQRSADKYGPVLAPILERLDLYRIFTSVWWAALVGLFSVSLVGNTLSRAGRILRDIRRPPVRRARAFFRSSVPARTGPLEGVDGSVLPTMLRAAGYRVTAESIDGTTHLLAEQNRWSPLASLVSHGALLLFVIGMGVVTPRFGYEAAIKVPVGEGRPTGFPDDPRTVLVQNEAFVAQFDRAGIPVEYRTTLAVYRRGEQIARKEVTVNDPLAVDGWSIHENFFGPAVEIVVRDETGLTLYSGAVVLDGNLGGRPEGLVKLPGRDVSLELLLGKGPGNVAELTVIGVRPPPRAGAAPVIAFGAVLQTGEGYRVPDPAIAIEFQRPSSYIGLIVKRDPGQGFIWAGAILLVAGVGVSLLRPRRRIWARYNSTTVRLAVVGGDPFAEAECARLVARLPDVGREVSRPVPPATSDSSR